MTLRFADDVLFPPIAGGFGRDLRRLRWKWLAFRYRAALWLRRAAGKVSP